MNTWNGEGLPPVGAEVETRIDYDKAPPYVLSNLADLGIDIRKKVPQFQKGIVAYCSKKYLVIFSPYECLVPMCCVEIRPILSAKQIAAKKREDAMKRMQQDLLANGFALGMDEIVAKFYDAGYRKFEIVEEDV